MCFPDCVSPKSQSTNNMVVSKRKRNNTDLDLKVNGGPSENHDVRPRKKRNVKTRSSGSAATKIKQQENKVQEVIKAVKSTRSQSSGDGDGDGDGSKSQRITRARTRQSTSNVVKKAQGNKIKQQGKSISSSKVASGVHSLNTQTQQQRKKNVNQRKITSVDYNKQRPPLPLPPPPHAREVSHIIPDQHPQRLHRTTPTTRTTSTVVKGANKIPESPVEIVSLESTTTHDNSDNNNNEILSNIIHIHQSNEEHDDHEGLDDGDIEKKQENMMKKTKIFSSSSKKVSSLSSSSSSNSTPKRFSLFQSFILYTTPILIIMIAMYDQQLYNLKQLSVKANTVILRKRNEINTINDIKQQTLHKLETTTQSLQVSQLKGTQCNETKNRMQLEIHSLMEKSKDLTMQLEESKLKLQSMTGSEEDIRHDLNRAWEEIHLLQEETKNLHELNSSCKNTSNILSKEKDNIQARIMELEFALDEADEQFKLLKGKYEQEISSRKGVELDLQRTKETVDTLEDQLDKEDGRAWYYQLQIKHLEGIIDDQDHSILDLKRLNMKLHEEKRALKVSLDLQVEEAVSALNAVATSATMRKAQEFKERENLVQIEKNNIMNEAANAVQSVVSAVRITSRL